MTRQDSFVFHTHWHKAAILTKKRRISAKRCGSEIKFLMAYVHTDLTDFETVERGEGLGGILGDLDMPKLKY